MTAPDRPAAPLSGSLYHASSRPTSGEAPGLEALLRERLKLDDLLQQQFRRDVTLLLTDIQDSTAYFERYGDLSGRQMVQRHNDLIGPLIASHQGTIVRSVRDTVMASYDEPTTAVQSAIAMQRALREHNRGREVAEQIHIRIGINAGHGLVETQDVFGDVVNVAARVEACALPDQILISSATYERLPPSVPCRFLGATQIQGKATPIELYEVSWDERRTFQETVLLRGPGVMARPTKIFALDICHEGERLKLSAHERWPGEEQPVRHYEYLEVSLAAMQQDVDAMVALLQRITDRRGTLAAATWQEVKARGTALYNQLLTPAIQGKLRASNATELFLYIDDALVHLPWELLFDGQDFLCRRFSMGRLVSTQQVLVERQERRPEQRLKMLIVADPQGDLLAAAREGKTIQADLAGEAERLHVDLRHRVRTDSLKAALAQYNVLHYAGHADYDLQEPAQSGWRLADGKLTAQDVMQLGTAAAVPSLVFCNACQSGQTQAWTLSPEAEQGIYGLANAFLLAGARHYIGSFWEIPDQPSSAFAIAFYRALAQGTGVGEALRRARQALIERYGEDSVVWASYVLYGDPMCRYLEAVEEEFVNDTEPVVAETVTRGESRPRQRRTALWGLAAGAVLTVALLAVLVGSQWWPGTALPPSPLNMAYQALDHGEPDKAHRLFQQQLEGPEPRARSQAYAGLAAVALASGDSQRALDFATQAESADPDSGYSHVIRGHIFWNQGKAAEALAAYRTATARPHTLPWQQAIAYDRLGRLYAAQGDTTKALEHYDKAMTQNRDLAVVHTNKAHLLDKLGKRQEALDLYRQALQLNPDDSLTTLLLGDAERRQQLTQDREQQQRIDQLVDELVRAYREDARPAATVDEWTSRPLTLAFLPFQLPENLSTRAGEAEFVVLSLTQALRASGRVTVVEREVLDKVLAELKLSATDIVNAPQTLRRGQILAARLLATGSLSRFGAMGLLSVRLIETETTMINAAVSQFVERPGEVIGIMQRVSDAMLHEIRRTYPLQGRIARLTPQGEVVLDIGARHGVTPGLVLQVFDSDTSEGTDTQVIPAPIGRIAVTQVTGQLSQARVLEQLEPLAPGRKVGEVLEP